MDTQNPIQRENARPGTRQWLLENPVSCDEPDWLQRAEGTVSTPVRRSSIEGYATKLTATKGDSIGLCVSSRFEWFTVAIYRMGWYGSDGARRMPDVLVDPQTGEVRTRFHGKYQATPRPDPYTRCVRCDWEVSCRLEIPADGDEWVSGVYLAKLGGFNGVETPTETYIVFVVRDDDRPAAFLAQLSTTTWHAYNRWGGFSAYSVQPAEQVWAQQLSFDRPFQAPDWLAGRFGSGAGLFLNNFTSKCSAHTPQSGFGNGRFGGWEYSMVRWLEREGYDVTYCTNTDLHDLPDPFKGRHGFLSLGHDEYWSKEMFVRVQRAVETGVIHAGFFSGNSIYRRIDLTRGSGDQSRTMASAQWAEQANEWTKFNGMGDGLNSSSLIGTTNWLSGNDFDQDVTLILRPHLPPDFAAWFLAGTRFQEWNQYRQGGASLYLSVGLLLGGHEVNTADPEDLPAGMLPVIGVMKPEESGNQWMIVGVWRESDDMILSGHVFSAGTVMWGWALDDFAVPGHEHAVSHPPRGAYVSADVQTLTRNVLARLGRSIRWD
jgi:hypothetical protein